MTPGRSLELYFIDGNPDGMLTAEVFNWTGHVLRIPRTKLAEGLSRKEARQTGVYILLGEEKDGMLGYVGEAEDMADRIRQHAKQKDWWDQAVLVTTAGDALHKAHVKFLESRLVEKALTAGVTRLENGNTPPRASLNEAAIANMESFLSTLQMVLPAIRVDIFQSGRRSNREVPADKSETNSSLVFEFAVPRHGVRATARLSGDEMIVEAGSSVPGQWVGDRGQGSSYWKLHDELLSSGIIQMHDAVARLTEDYAFTSPSAAAAIVAGRSANGRTSWKLDDGRTYADWEAEKLAGLAS